MRYKEFLPESMGGTTTSGSVATVRNTAPEVIKKRNKHARR